MSNNSGNHFDNQLILYFFFITSLIYVGIYLTITSLGYLMTDIPSNGNVITPLITDLFNLISSVITFLVSFSLFGVVPFGFLSGIAAGFTSLINQISLFVGIWNVLNIYVFYIIFIPWALVLFLIIFDLVTRLIEGLIP